MNSHKKIYLLIVMAVIQLAVPGKMIYDHASVLNTGVIYKFQTEPVDPSDPLRGKYINLNFKARKFYSPINLSWKNGQDVFVKVENDSNGFAKIIAVLYDPPLEGDYFKASIDYVENHEQYQTLNLDLPFTRFYLEESRAANVETEYVKANKDSLVEAYATVAIKNGAAVISNVFIAKKAVRIEN